MGLQRTPFISLILTTLGAVACLFLFPNNLYPQSHNNKFGLGFKVGGKDFTQTEQMPELAQTAN